MLQKLDGPQVEALVHAADPEARAKELANPKLWERTSGDRGMRARRLRSSRDGQAAWIWLRGVGIAAAVAVAYFLAARLSNSFLITPETVIFWPAAGISSGLLISLWSTARWPVLAGVIVATAAANLLRSFDGAATATWILGNAAEPLIIAGLMQYYFGAHFKIDRLYCVLGLFAAAVAGAAVASTWWTFVYYYLFASLDDPVATWLHWIVSDFAGIVSVAPLVIGIAGVPQRPPAWREAIESIVALGLLGVITGVLVSLPTELWNTVVPAALVFPMLLWLAARYQPVFAAAGAFIVAMTIAFTAIYGLGHFGDTGLSINARVLQTQAIIVVVAFGTAVLASLFAERRTSAARLVNSYMLLEHERDSKLLNVEAAVAWIAHELRQPLTGVAMTSFAALRYLGKTPPDQEKASTALHLIRDQVGRLDEVLDGIRAFFRTGEGALSAVDVNELIRRVLDAVREDFARDEIMVRLDLGARLPRVDGNASQLQQVISNLVRNAQEAMRTTENRRRELRLRTELNGEDRLEIAVEDTGPGIDPAQLDRAFNAFFTTKAQGMGMGLAMCRLIVERHGGAITARSDGKSGARFNITIPVTSEPIQQ